MESDSMRKSSFMSRSVQLQDSIAFIGWPTTLRRCHAIEPLAGSRVGIGRGSRHVCGRRRETPQEIPWPGRQRGAVLHCVGLIGNSAELKGDRVAGFYDRTTNNAQQAAGIPRMGPRLILLPIGHA